MKNKKGFTLVEIMIVVVIIGLLAAMAIPAFQQVRTNSRTSQMENDGRQIGAAAQQYMLENGVTTASIVVDTATGEVTGGLSVYVRNVASGITFLGDPAGFVSQGSTFTLTTTDTNVGNAGTIEFNDEGKVETP